MFPKPGPIRAQDPKTSDDTKRKLKYLRKYPGTRSAKSEEHYLSG
jgi:hypothetical protein